MLPLLWLFRMMRPQNTAPSAAESERDSKECRTFGETASPAQSTSCSHWGFGRYRLDPDNRHLATVLQIPKSRLGSIATGRFSPALQFVGATVESVVGFVNDGATIGAYIANYASQRQGHEVVFSQNRPGGEGVHVVRAGK
jgi:hypothetical protein